MSVTAARLGSSPLRFDWSALGRTQAGTSATQSIAEAWSELRARFQSGEVGFYDTPVREDLSQLQASIRLAHELRASGQFQDVLFLGIGGSALGPIALLSALRERATPEPRFHFLENPDPIEWKQTLQKLLPQNTLVICVTKSGSTFETLAQFLCALEWLGPSRLVSHTVAITDPEKGDLRALATQKGLQTLPIAPSLGGRFSIFSPVGLFAAALAGLQAEEFLKGAQQARDYFEKAPLEKNSVFTIAQELLRQASKRPIHVIMPYATPLRMVGDWFVQLWGESLGKNGKGFTPLAALGATDQHSILQLLRDGPDDKVTLFLTVDRVGDAIQIPRTLPGLDLNRFPAFQILQGHSFAELLQIEYRATAQGLTQKSRPHLTLQLDALDERSIGALLFSLCVLTAITGTLWGINPFDQPGVEDGKVFIRQALNDGAAERYRQLNEDENSPVARLRRDHESLRSGD